MLVGWLSGSGSANPPVAQPYPRPCPSACVPNVQNWGYYQTRWRQWPGEFRPEQINPKRPVSEVLPTPPGQELIPPPRAVMPQPPKAQEDEFYLPEGTITPQEGLLLPERRPRGETKPLLENGFPELPPLEPSPAESQPEAKPELNAEPKPEPLPENSSEPQAEPNPPVKPQAEPNPPVKPQAEPNPPVKSQAEPNPPVKSSGSFEPERRYLPPRREVAAAAAASRQSEGRIAPVTGGMEPERNSRYGTARRDGGLAPLAGPIGPERNAGYNMPSYGPMVSTPPPTTAPNRDEDVTPASGVMEPERNDRLPGSYRADPICSTMPEGPREVNRTGYAATESAGMAEAGDQFVVPPVALNGFCPVELVTNGQWTQGDLRWTVVHKGFIYRLSGDRQRREFLENPDRYAPVESGKDCVLLVDQRQSVPGNLEFCAVYQGRLFIFSSAETQAQFNGNPDRYAAGR